MRISGGIAKGRRTATKRLFTKTETGERLRPTSSKVREALFDIIRNSIDGANFADLYAGTGAVGFEALSRGAGAVLFVEPEDIRLKTIINNAEEFGFSNKVTVVKGRACDFLKKAYTEKKKFDIMFLDPPYYSEEIEKVLPLIGEDGLLNDGGMVIVEHFFKKKIPEQSGLLKMDRSYRYGDTKLTIYRKVEI